MGIHDRCFGKRSETAADADIKPSGNTCMRGKNARRLQQSIHDDLLDAKPGESRESNRTDPRAKALRYRERAPEGLGDEPLSAAAARLYVQL
jgi:hypothetical protein